MGDLRTRIRREESGLTLIELMIAMVLMVVAVGVATDGLFSLGRSSAAAQLHTFNQQQNRVGMERLTYLLRQATYGPDVTDVNRDSNPIITHADPMGVTFTSRGAGTSTVYRYRVAINGAKLQITRYQCAANSNPCVWNSLGTTALVSHIAAGSTGPCASKANTTNGTSDADHPFRFFVTNSSTASLQEQNVDAGINSSRNDPTGSDDATLRHIDTVQINLFTRETGAGISNTCEALSARVNLRNLIWIA